MACRLLVEAYGLLSCSMWTLSCGMQDLVPRPGMNPSALHWERGVLTTGPLGKSPLGYFLTFLPWELTEVVNRQPTNWSPVSTSGRSESEDFIHQQHLLQIKITDRAK